MWIKKIMETEVFKKTMLKSKENYAKSLYNKQKKTNLPKFLQGAIRRVSRMNNLTDYIIPSSAQTIMTQLMNSRLPNLKYFTSHGSSNKDPATDKNTEIGNIQNGCDTDSDTTDF